MAGSIAKSVHESMAKTQSEPVPGSESESKSNPIAGSTSGLTDDIANKPHSYSKPPFLCHVDSHLSPFPMPNSDIVCTTCAQLSYKRLCAPGGQSYHESWTALVENAAQGCRLCTFFMTMQAHNKLGIPWQSSSLFLCMNSTYLDLFGSNSHTTWRYGLCLPADIDEPLPESAKYVKNIIRYPDRACEKAIDKIRAWINECETAHPKCRKPVISSLPSRVLDLFHTDSSQRICLVEGKGLKAEYVTLSYCWGKEAENADGQSTLTPRISTCTSQNISRLFQGVSIDVLPLLYRDAVIMTQKLGKRYLWIDSLCIIQDSKEDWSKECPRMADIYANSFLTISAASCRNKQEGFIKVTTFETQAKLTTIPGTQGQYIYVRSFGCSSPPTPLIGRAWAFQERLLSTRVLHLTSLEMVFQCDNHQSGGCGEDHSGHGCGDKSLLWKSHPSQHSLYDQFKAEELNDIWFRVVENYSNLKLTYETDRLPALSSIAHILQSRFLIQNQLQANYVAGLWKNDLAFGLLWSVRDCEEIKAGGLSPYVAPTWSWASIQRGVAEWSSFAPRNLLKLRVVDVQAHPSTSNPFGEISSAYLIVDAPLRRILTNRMQIQEAALPIDALNILVEDFANAHFSFDAGNHGIPASRSIWLLPCMMDAVLGEAELQNKERSFWGVWDGLALELVDKKKQIYKRIGVFGIPRLFGEERTWYDLDFVDTRITII